MNDHARARAVCHRFVDRFEPDLDFGPIFMFPAKAMSMLGLKWLRWAGHGLGDDVMYQFVEGEYMTGEEYDEFLFDPSHFMTTRWLPRSFEALGGLASFPPMRAMMWFGWTGLLAGLADPGVQEALRRAAEAGAERGRWFESIARYRDEIRAKGFPQAYAAFSWPPFDIVGETLRGTRGILTDMIRRPEKLLAAVEKATRIPIEYGAGAAGADLPLCWIWLHKGSDGFMSPEQYRTFYWPFLKRTIDELVARGRRSLRLDDGTTFTGAVGEFLTGATEVAAFVATAGPEVERLGEEASRSRAALLALSFHALGACLAETAVDRLVGELRRRLAPGQALTLRYSPGYCGIPLRQQARLFRLLDARRVGVELLPSLVMRPLKSVSGLLGIGPAAAVRAYGNPCDTCSLVDCTMRRSGGPHAGVVPSA